MKPRYGLFSVLGSMPDPISRWMVYSMACMMGIHVRPGRYRFPGLSATHDMSASTDIHTLRLTSKAVHAKHT